MISKRQEDIDDFQPGRQVPAGFFCLQFVVAHKLLPLREFRASVANRDPHLQPVGPDWQSQSQIGRLSIDYSGGLDIVVSLKIVVAQQSWNGQIESGRFLATARWVLAPGRIVP